MSEKQTKKDRRQRENSTPAAAICVKQPVRPGKRQARFYKGSRHDSR